MEEKQQEEKQKAKREPKEIKVKVRYDQRGKRIVIFTDNYR